MLALALALFLSGPVGFRERASTPAKFDPTAGINGPAVQALLNAAPSGSTVLLPSQVVTLGTLHIGKPLTIVCPPGGTTLYGSLQVSARPISLADASYGQISNSVRQSVQVVDLTASGLYDSGPYSLGPWGFGGNNTYSLAEPQLFCDDSPMYLSQWPTPSTVGGLPTFSVSTGFSGYTAISDTSLPSWGSSNWAGNNRVIVHQYPTSYTESIDWYSSATLNGQTLTLDTQIPNTFGNMGSSCRYYVQNVIEQLLLPGQYYLSRNEAKLYFIPTNPLPHTYRLSLAASDLLHLDAGSDGTAFTGGPLLLKQTRASGMASTSAVTNVSLGKVYASGCGEDSFNFPYAHTGWTCSVLVARYCGGAGLWFGTPAGTPSPLLTSWNDTFSNIYEDHCCQRCRTYRGGLHLNGVGVVVGQFTSLNNPNQAVIWDSHDTTLSNVWIDCSLMEGEDVGAIYSAQDPTTFGCQLSNVYIQNIAAGTSPKGASNDRRGVYLDNLCSGVNLQNTVFVNCDSDYCVYWSGGQANTVSGLTTYGCSASPLGMDDRGSSQTSFSPSLASWWQSGGEAYALVTAANALSGSPYSKYGTPWAQLLSTSPYLGIPRNCSIAGVGISSSSTGSLADFASAFSGTSVSQPQGSVLPGVGVLLGVTPLPPLP